MSRKAAEAGTLRMHFFARFAALREANQERPSGVVPACRNQVGGAFWSGEAAFHKILSVILCRRLYLTAISMSLMYWAISIPR